METQSERVVEVDEGVGSAIPEQPIAEVAVDSGDPQPEASGPPEGYEGIPPELWPDANGNSPQLTPEMIRKLRGKYFTVRHAAGECGHKIDAINQPKNNCHDCWGVFFNTHPQLVEVAHQFYQTQGRKPMVGMRGEKFVRMFEKYMALLYRANLERKKQQELQRGVENPEPGSTAGDDKPSETSAVSEG
jgi:hypothetical protein